MPIGFHPSQEWMNYTLEISPTIFETTNNSKSHNSNQFLEEVSNLKPEFIEEIKQKKVNLIDDKLIISEVKLFKKRKSKTIKLN